MSEDSSFWMGPGGTVDILQVAGSTQSLSFVASNEASGRSKFCTLFFEFEGLLTFEVFTCKV